MCGRREFNEDRIDRANWIEPKTLVGMNDLHAPKHPRSEESWQMLKPVLELMYGQDSFLMNAIDNYYIKVRNYTV